MKIYTVHGPNKATDDSARDAERITFVRDGFHFWAFVLAPLWMLWRRMWLVLLGYIVLIVALEVGLWAVGASRAVQFGVGFLVALLVGFEAATLQRFTLRKWRDLGVVVGRDQEDAERRFFDAWVARDTLPPPVNPPPFPPSVQSAPGGLPPAPTLRIPEGGPEVIGLFPEPQSPR